jgi:hypothetical protein
MTCRRQTGAYVTVPGHGEREIWSGPTGARQIPCGYAGDPHEITCHLIATHHLAVSEARAQVATWAFGV